jgi:hypothetical protein
MAITAILELQLKADSLETAPKVIHATPPRPSSACSPSPKASSEGRRASLLSPAQAPTLEV